MTISVVIPCYNSGRWIGEALASVQAQTRPPAEVIVVDDASSDDSVAVVSRFSGVKLIRAARNAGAAAARNTGLEAATGQLVAWLDADDVWDRNHLETVAELLDRHPGAALGFSLMRMFGDRDAVWGAALPALQPTPAFWPSWRHVVVPMSTIIVRRDAALAVGGFDPALRCVEDFDFLLRLAWKHDFVCTHDVTSRYRKHEGSLSRRFLDCVLVECTIRTRFLERIRNTEPRDPDVVARLEQEWRREWEDRMVEAWTRRDLLLLRFYLGLTILVPGAAPLAAKWRRRAWLSPLWRVWDGLNRRPATEPRVWPGS